MQYQLKAPIVLFLSLFLRWCLAIVEKLQKYFVQALATASDYSLLNLDLFHISDNGHARRKYFFQRHQASIKKVYINSLFYLQFSI